MRELILERGPEFRRVVASVLVIGVPAIFLRFTQDPFGLPKLALLVAGVGLLLAIRVMEIAQGSPWEPLGIVKVPAVALVAAFTLSWLFSAYRGWALFGSHGRWQGLLPYVAVALFGVLLADAFAGRARELAERFLWSGVIVGAYALMQAVGADPFEWNLFGAPTTAVSTVGNPNFTGGFLGMVVPVGLGLLLFDPVRRRTTARLFVFVIAGWVVARSQGGWAAGVAGSAVVGGAYLRARWRWAFPVALVAAVSIMLLTAGVVVINILAPENRFAIDAFSVRAGWWIAAARMFASAPLLGFGPDTFAIEGITHRTLEDALRFNYDFANDPHSVPLAMLANIGLIGFVGFSIPIGWALWKGIRHIDGQAIVFLGVIVAYVTQSLVSIDELSLRIGLWVGVAGVACGLIVDPAPARRPKATRKKPLPAPLKKIPLVAGAALVALALVIFSGALVLVDARMKNALDLLRRDEWRAAVSDYEGALALRDSEDYQGLFAIAASRPALDDSSQGPSESDREFLYTEAQEAFSFIDEVPYVFSLVSYARLLDGWAADHGLNPEPKALALFERALTLDPLNPAIRAEFAATLIRDDDFDRAVAILEPHKEVVDVTAYPDYWGALALAAARTGDLELAREAVEMVRSAALGGELFNRAVEILE